MNSPIYREQLCEAVAVAMALTSPAAVVAVEMSAQSAFSVAMVRSHQHSFTFSSIAMIV